MWNIFRSMGHPKLTASEWIAQTAIKSSINFPWNFPNQGANQLFWGRDWRISFWKAKTLKLKERFSYFRSSYWKCYGRKDALRNFAKLTRKHLCQSLFFNDVTGTLRLRHRYFSEAFAKFPRTPFCRTPLGKDII